MFTMHKTGRKSESDVYSVASKTSKGSKGSEKKKSHRRFSLRDIFYRSRAKSSKSRISLEFETRSEMSLNSHGDRESTVQSTTSADAFDVIGNAHNSTGQQPMGSKHECPLCLMEQPAENFPPIMTCHHRSCRDCLRQYLKIEITESRVNIACPECAERFHPNDIKDILSDNTLMDKYEQFMLRRVLVLDPDARWCPAPDCGYAVIASGCASCPKIKCERPGCDSSFCYHCKQHWHPNQTCDAARAQRSPHLIRSSSISYSHDSSHNNEIKPCPRCGAFIIKMDDGSCNHMTCAVCGAEFCWLCMKEISDLHYLSPSGCTFWGKKPWSRKKKILWQLGTLVGAPVGIGLVAGIAVPAMIIGIPVWVGRKLHTKYKLVSKHKRNLIITGGVSASILISPIMAGLAVGIGVPILLAYVYGVVPISLCRSGGCGVTTNSSGVRFEFEEENETNTGVPGPYAGADNQSIETTSHRAVTNPSIGPSIGDASLGMTNSLSASGSHMDRVGMIRDDCDRESASTRALAGSSLNGSLSGSAVAGPSGFQNRLEVHADVTSNPNLQKRASFSSESANFSLSEKSNILGYGDDASTKALAGSICARDKDNNSAVVPPFEVTVDDHSINKLRHQSSTSGKSIHGSPQSSRSVRITSTHGSPMSGRSVTFYDEEGKHNIARRTKRTSSRDRSQDNSEKERLSVRSLEMLESSSAEPSPRDKSNERDNASVHSRESATDHFRKSSARSSSTSYDSVDSHISNKSRNNTSLTEVESDRPLTYITKVITKSIPSVNNSLIDGPVLCNIVEENKGQGRKEPVVHYRRLSCEMAIQNGRLSPDMFA